MPLRADPQARNPAPRSSPSPSSLSRVGVHREWNRLAELVVGRPLDFTFPTALQTGDRAFGFLPAAFVRDPGEVVLDTRLPSTVNRPDIAAAELGCPPHNLPGAARLHVRGADVGLDQPRRARGGRWPDSGPPTDRRGAVLAASAVPATHPSRTGLTATDRPRRPGRSPDMAESLPRPCIPITISLACLPRFGGAVTRRFDNECYVGACCSSWSRDRTSRCRR